VCALADLQMSSSANAPQLACGLILDELFGRSLTKAVRSNSIVTGTIVVLMPSTILAFLSAWTTLEESPWPRLSLH
jgi:hypothetical protein